MIFGVGALMVVTTMLAMTEKGAKVSGELNRHKNVQAVLKAGIAAAINEMSRARAEGSYDPGGDGVGAITRPGSSGFNDGVPVTVTTTGGGTLTLGFYRTTIRKVGGRDILTVVAAWPSFDAPPDRRILTAAEVEVVVAPPGGDFNPVQIVGPIDADNASIDVSTAAKVNVSGIDTNPSGHADPDPANVPGANVDTTDDGGGGDDALIDEFKSDVVANADSFTGANPSDPGGTAVSGNATVTERTSNAFNDTTLSGARAQYRADLDAILDDPTGYTPLATSIDGGAGSVIGTGGVYVVPGNLQITGKVSGSGTLIIRDSLQLKSGADLDWDGDIIIAGYDLTSHAIVNNASFESGNGASLSLEGNFIMLGEDTKYVDKSGNAGGSLIDGSLLLLSDDNRTSEIYIDGGTNFTVEGVTVQYGEDIRLIADNGSTTTLRSWNAVFTDSDDDENKLKIDVKNGSKLDLVYDNTQVREGMEPLWDYLGDSVTSQMVADSYWEGNALTILEDQQELITGVAQPSATTGLVTGFGATYTGDWGR